MSWRLRRQDLCHHLAALGVSRLLLNHSPFRPQWIVMMPLWHLFFWEMDFSKYGVPDLDEPSSPVPDFEQVPVEFVHDAEPLDYDPDAGNSTQPPVISQDFVTLGWAAPLANRNAVAKCRAFGVPVLRFHSDRAKEFQSLRLVRWLAEQSIHVTKSAPEDPAANGTAESAVKEIKRLARRCLLSGELSSSLWLLAVRQASEQLWRSALSQLGCPTRPLLAFGTVVEARSREWLKRADKQWSPRTLPGRLVGPAPQTPSAYVALLANDTLCISSSVHPITAVSGRYRLPMLCLLVRFS